MIDSRIDRRDSRRRFEKARRARRNGPGRSAKGSVLILVVALLVILALMGTAYLAAARLDRADATGTGGTGLIVNSAAPAQMELIQNIAEKHVEHRLMSDVVHRYNAGSSAAPNDVHYFRPPAYVGRMSSNPSFTYEHFEAPYWGVVYTAPQNFDSDPERNGADLEEDAWLAARLPTPPPADNSTGLTWDYITSWPPFVPFGADNSNNLIRSFSSPMVVGGGDPRYRTRKTRRIDGPGDDPEEKKQTVEISSVVITYPTAFATPTNLAGRTRVYPALKITPPGGQPRTFIAGDADGDGIADSGLFEIRDPQFTGDFVSYPDPDGPQPIRYFAAMRIVDNNSAINVNTARTMMGDVSLSGNTVFARNLGIFRANVGLWELWDRALPASLYNLERDGLDFFRHNKPAGPNSINSRAVTDNGSQRSDFEFVSEGDALESQVARRLENPGFNDTSVRYRTFGRTDLGALAYRGTLMDPLGSAADIENFLEHSVKYAASNYAVNNRYNMFRFYGADQHLVWYHQNYNFGGIFDTTDNSRASFLQGNQWPQPQPTGPFHISPIPPIRSLLTTMNPVSNAVPVHDMSGLGPVVKSGSTHAQNTDDQMPQWAANLDPAVNAKANVNTANFGELWRAYWAVMSERDGSGNLVVPSLQGPGVTAESQPRERMFRPSVRGRDTFWAPYDQLLLRAALAAVNTMDLADPNDYDDAGRRNPVTGRVVSINGYNVSVFGTEPQPYITEVYANNDDITIPPPATKKNGKGYVAIELVNPFPTVMNLKDWQVWVLERPANGPVRYTRLHTFDDTAQIPAAASDGSKNGHLVLENFRDAQHSLNKGTAPPATDNDAHWRPKASKLTERLAAGDTDIKVYFVPGANSKFLGDCVTQKLEFMLMRPAETGSNNPDTTIARLQGGRIPFAPVDSFDFSGFPSPKAKRSDPNDNNSAITSYEMTSWHYVRPNKPTSNSGSKQWHFVYPGRYDDKASGVRYKLDDVEYEVPIDNTIDDKEPWAASEADQPIELSKLDSEGTYNESFPIQLANEDWAGGNKRANKFPFGGFARNGDILKVPFIGGYIVHAQSGTVGPETGTVEEINPVTMDAFYAEHKDLDRRLLSSANPNNDRPEIGRFCPDALSPAYYRSYDPANPGNSPVPPVIRGYEWASDLFDYLTVQSPKDDYLPNVDPRNFSGATPVANGSGQANVKEDHIGVEGLVNINTAPWQVLAMLPLVVKENGGPGDFVDRVATTDMAKAIVEHRERYGPFRSIFDLHKVKIATGDEPLRYPGQLDTVIDPGIEYGDMDPLPGGAAASARDRVVNDFEHKYIQLTRLSNLITTRSDTFTVYILVQAWQNPASTNSNSLPVLLGERRTAFVVDRSQLNRLTAVPKADLPKVGISAQ